MRLLIVGASGHAKVVADAAARAGIWEIVGYVAESGEGTGPLGHPLLGADRDLAAIVPEHQVEAVVVAIGDNWVRARVVARTAEALPGIRFATVVHPSAEIGAGVDLGAGTVVLAGAVVNPDAVVGEHCILNTRASVDHDCRIGDFASIAPGATLGGGVRVGTFSAVSLGASVIHGIEIGEHALVAAGSVVVRDVAPNSVTAGVPARVVRRREPGERYL